MKSELDLINHHVFIGMMVQAYPEKISQAERERNHDDAKRCCESLICEINSYDSRKGLVYVKKILDIERCITSKRQQPEQKTKSDQKTKSSIIGKFISVFAKTNQNEIKDKDDKPDVIRDIMQSKINKAAEMCASEDKRCELEDKIVTRKRAMLKQLRLAENVADYAVLPGRSLALNQAINNYFEYEHNINPKPAYFKLMESYDELLKL